MTLLARLFKKLAVALALLTAMQAVAHAVAFSAKRGINLDAWITWPNERRWGEESVLRPFPEWRRSLHEDGLKALKADGFDFVRMPVDPAVFLSGKTVGFRDDLFADVLSAARLVNRAGLKVVVDMHLMPADGSNRAVGMSQVMDDPAVFDRYVDAVRRMAGTLAKEDPQEVALELMNEPVIKCDGAAAADWQAKLKRLFAAARASAPRLSLVLSGGCWALAEGLAAVDPKEIPDDNIIWTFHSYVPFVLTHQGAGWTGDFSPYVTGIPYPPYADKARLDAALDGIRARIRAEAPWSRRAALLRFLDEQMATVDTPEKLKATMAAPFEAAARWADANGIDRKDVLLGEFGMIRQEHRKQFVMPAAWRAAYVKDMIALAESHGFPWALWSYSGAFGVVQAFDGEKAEPDVLEVVKALK